MIRLLEKLTAARAQGREGILYLSPRLLAMPLPIQRYDDPFLPFSKALIDATRGQIAGYCFDLAAYLALGGAGAVALERAIAYVVGAGDAALVHGPLTTEDYAPAMSDAAFAADGVTIIDAPIGEAYTQRGIMPIVLTQPLNTMTALTLPGWDHPVPVYGDAVVYAGRGDDFIEAAAHALTAARR